MCDYVKNTIENQKETQEYINQALACLDRSDKAFIMKMFLKWTHVVIFHITY